MTGTIELSDQDIQDIYYLITDYEDSCLRLQVQSTKHKARIRRLVDLKNRLLKVEVNIS